MMILGVIPARGGSKGIPYKNLMPIAGKPLIAWSINDARESKLLDRFIVSTEDSKITKVAKEYGAEVLERPMELADDHATTMSVLRHVAENIPEADSILLMQPTNPIRVNQLIDKFIAEYKSHPEADSAATGFMCRHWKWGTRKKNLPRQIEPGYFYDDGNLYILSRENILKDIWCGDKIVPVEVETHYHYEIDDAVEAVATEAVLNHILRFENNQEKKLGEFLPKMKLLVFDFDGVFTDDKVYISDNGSESVCCSRKDSYGLSKLKDNLKKRGAKILILSTEENKVVSKRAKKLKIEAIHGSSDKLKSLKKYCADQAISLNEVAYMGNDLNDYEVMTNSAFAISPDNAYNEIKAISDFIVPKKGGHGAIRYLADSVLNRRD